MNDLFGVNYETNAYECEKITIKKADDHIVKKIQKCMEEKTEFKENSDIPKWLNALQRIGLYGGMICSVFVIDSCLDSNLMEALKTQTVFAVLTIVLFLLSTIVFLVRLRKQNKMLESDDLKEHNKKLEKAVDEALKHLNVPESAPEVDIYGELFTYNKKGYKLVGIRQFTHINNAFKVFKKDNMLCFADAANIYGIKLDDIKELRKETNKILILGWNKKEQCSAYKLKKTGFGATVIQEYYRLIVDKNGDDSCVIIPPYEIEHFQKILNMEIK